MVLPLSCCLSLPLPPLPCLVSLLSLSVSPSSSPCLVLLPPSLIFSPSAPRPPPPPAHPRTHSHLPQTAPSHRLSLSRALIRCLVTALPSSPAETIATGSLRRGHSSPFCPLQARGRSNYRYSVGGDAFVCSPFTASRLPGPEAAERCLTKRLLCLLPASPAVLKDKASSDSVLSAEIPYAAGEGEWGTERGALGRWSYRQTDLTAPAREVSQRNGGKGTGSGSLAAGCVLLWALTFRPFLQPVGSVPSNPDLPSLCTLNSYPTFITRSSTPCLPLPGFTGDHISLCGASLCATIVYFLSDTLNSQGLFNKLSQTRWHLLSHSSGGQECEIQVQQGHDLSKSFRGRWFLSSSSFWWLPATLGHPGFVDLSSQSLPQPSHGLCVSVQISHQDSSHWIRVTLIQYVFIIN